MNPAKTSNIGDSFDAELAAQASRLFYQEDFSKSDIADLLSISRFKVGRLIDEARERGLVRIEVFGPDPADNDLAHRLREQFGLLHALVVPTVRSDDATLRELGRVAGRLVMSNLESGGGLGLGWGRSVGATVPFLRGRRQIDVVQLAGGFPSTDSEFNGEEVVIQAADQLEGSGYLLHAPALASNQDARDVIWGEPAVSATVTRFQSLDVLLTGIGALAPSPTSAIYRGNVLGAETTAALRDHGVVGDAVCHFVDSDGHLIPELEEQVVGISAELIRQVPLRVSVMAGAAKVEALRAALASGLPNALVIDARTAMLIDGRGDS